VYFAESTLLSYNIPFTASTLYMLKIHFIAITSWLLDGAARKTDVILEVRAMNSVYEDRVIAIKRYLEGEQPSQIYTSLGYSQTWFFKWKLRYELYGLDGLNEVSSAPDHQARQMEAAIKTAIVNMRTCRENRERDDTKYAFIGAVAIQKELQELGYDPPSVSTVHPILGRHGLICPAPASASVREVLARHYPAFTLTRPGQLHQLAFVGPRYLPGSSQKYYFYHLRDVCSRRVALAVGDNHQASTIVNAVIRSWQRMGVPTRLPHDNALEFRGSQQHPRSAGLLTKRCLAQQGESVFIPVRQPWGNGSIENVNGLFQRFVVNSRDITDFPHLQREVTVFETAANPQHPPVPLDGKTSLEYERFVTCTPKLWAPNFTLTPRFRFQQVPEGKVSLICRLRKSGNIPIATEKFDSDPPLAWDDVYATISVKEQALKIYHKGELIKEFPSQLNI
jgi:putative transposase